MARTGSITINFGSLSRLQVTPIARIAGALYLVIAENDVVTYQDVVDKITEASGHDRRIRFRTKMPANLMDMNVLGMMLRQYGLDGHVET